jgi:hypothetical protein
MKTRRISRECWFAVWPELSVNSLENSSRKTRESQDVSLEYLECDRASLNERTMMLKIGAMRQAVNETV